VVTGLVALWLFNSPLVLSACASRTLSSTSPQVPAAAPRQKLQAMVPQKQADHARLSRRAAYGQAGRHVTVVLRPACWWVIT